MRLMLKIWLLSLLLIFLPASLLIAGSGFDQGVSGSSSALNQLEAISGGQINRPPVLRNQVPRSSAISTPNSSAMAAFSTGMMMIQFLDMINSSGQQQADIARAQAEAERQRLIQEQQLRLQRATSASRLRDFWDRGDKEISESLGSAFEVPGQAHGTNFFGIASTLGLEPVAQADQPIQQTDTAVGRLGDGARPMIIGSGAPDVTRGGMSQPTDSLLTNTSSLQAGILKNGVEYVKEAAADTLKEIIKECLPARWRNAKLAVEHVEKVNEFTNNLFQALEPERLVRTLANGSPDEYQEIIADLDRVMQNTTSLGMPDDNFPANALEIGYKLKDYINRQRLARLFGGGM